MKSFPIGGCLSALYFGILGVIPSPFNPACFFAIRYSILRTVEQKPPGPLGGVRRLIERTARYEPDDLRRELREHSELAGSTLLQVADRQGNWLYRSASMDRYEIPRLREASTVPSTLVLNDMPLRVLTTEIQVGGQSYLVQTAVPLDDFYGA